MNWAQPVALRAALVYAGRGWPVFPCHSPNPARPGGCTCADPGCGSPGKHPRIAGGLHAATVDATAITRWWHRFPDANVAVRTGAASGLVVIDIDPDHGGEASLAALVARHGPLPPGRVVRTGGGRHHYIAHPGRTVRNDTGRRLGPGLDIRGDGGYVIAPPSRHPSGAIYEVAGPPTDIPPLPGWLDRLLDPPRRSPPPPARPPTAATRWATAALDGELARLRAAPEGTRNDTLNRVAFRLGQLAATGCIDPDDLRGRLVAEGMGIGLGEHETHATVRSGLDAGLAHPPAPPRPHQRPGPAPAPAHPAPGRDRA